MTYVNEDKRQVEQVVWFVVKRDGSYMRADGYEPARTDDDDVLFGPYVMAAPIPDEVLAELSALRAVRRLDGEIEDVAPIKAATAKKGKA